MPDPTVDVASYYNNGMSWEEFVEASGDEAPRMESFFEDFDTDLDEDTLAFFNGRTPLQVLAIAESWCPDVVQNVAVIARISDEVPGMELSIVTRDDNPELMNEYLSGGKKRIPVIAFFDMTFRELGRWAGRSASAEAWIRSDVAPAGSIEDMDDAKKQAFNDEYDRRFRESFAREAIAEWQQLLSEEDL